MGLGEAGSDSQRHFQAQALRGEFRNFSGLAGPPVGFGLRLEGNAQAPAEQLLTLWSRTAPVLKAWIFIGEM